MANEFIIKNGYRSQGNSEVTGSLNVTAGITGSLQGTATTASFVSTASYASNSATASYVQTAQTASYVLNAVSASFSTSASYATTTAAAGTQGYIQFNNAGILGASSDFSYNTASRSLQNGTSVVATGQFSHAEGRSTIASGSQSHAEGISTQAVGNYSHAEGESAVSTGASSHAEGSGTQAIGNYTHAEGKNTISYGPSSHAEGESTITYGNFSHAEGHSAKTGTGTAYLAISVVNGLFTLSSSYGDQTGVLYAGERVAFDDSAYLGNYGYAYSWIISSSAYDGIDTTTVQLLDTTINTDSASIANILGGNSGDQLLAGYVAHAEGEDTTAFGIISHAEGSSTYALGGSSHAEGSSTKAIGASSHAEGASTQAIGDYSHAEGDSTIAYALSSHAEGSSTIAGWRAYGTSTLITNGVFELETKYGDLTADFAAGQFVLIDDGTSEINGTASVYKFEIASSTYNATPATEITLVDTSINTTATYPVVGLYGLDNPLYADALIGQSSHAQGARSKAIGVGSNAAGYETFALGYYQSVVGQYNEPVSTPNAFIVGDGDASTRHNLLVAASGSVNISGSLQMSGSILPAVSGSVTSSFSLGSATQAWKDIWVSNGSINMLDATGSIQTSIKSTATGVAITGSLNGTVSSIVKGEATIDFGAPPGSNYATASISTPNVTNNSNIHIYIMSTASADHNAMEHQIFSLYGTVMPDNIIDNTSFDIVALSQLRLNGTFKVRYTINNN